MSWNPNDNDPWGRKNSPPDLDDAINQLKKMFASGGSGGDSDSDNDATSFKFDFKFFSYLIMGLITLYVFLGIRIVNEADRLVVLTFGNYNRVLGPGLQFHFPVVEEIYAAENVSKIRTFVLPTNMLTKDENIEHYGFLVLGYKPEYYYWDIWIWSRTIIVYGLYGVFSGSRQGSP